MAEGQPSPPGECVPSKKDAEDEREFIRDLENLQGPILRFFAGRGFPPDECRDLAQETFLRAVQGRNDFRWDSTVATYVRQIASNVANNSIRRKKTQKRGASEIPLEAVGDAIGRRFDVSALLRDNPTPLEVALFKERRRLLREALDELPPQMRRCILLRIDQNRKYREIADLLQLSINTVKSHLHEGKKRLMQALI